MQMGLFYIFLILTTFANGQVSNVTMILPNNSNQIPIYYNNLVTPLFTQKPKTFNCAEPDIYIYQQTSTQYDDNTPYQIRINTTSFVNLSISSVNDVFHPSLNQISCNNPGCLIQVNNNCPGSLERNNYYDEINLNITGLPLIVYKVNCNTSYIPTIFEWGLFILILLCAAIVFASAYYSRAWSLGGTGYQIKIWFVLVLDVLIIIGGIIGAFASFVLNIILIIICWILGPICVALCSNQILWLFKIHSLNKKYFELFRGIDIISITIGIGLTTAWFFSEKNWILSDILSISIIVAIIKTLKFTSLKLAVISTLLVLTIQIVGSLLIHYLVGESYNVLILNQFNNPLLIQMPAISLYINQKCSWLPLNEIIFPGIVISYLRRFDDSRNTRVYMIISCIAFFIGSMLWMIMSLFNIHSWPFSIFSEPSMFLIVVIFAYQRNEIKTIWTGEFYDEEFRDKYEVDTFKKNFVIERSSIEMNKTIFKKLKIDGSERDSQARQSEIQDKRQGAI